MKIRIPTLTREHAAGLEAVIEDAARAAGISDHEMLRITTHLFDAMADNMSRGTIITVPGFGKFAAVYIKHFRKRAGLMRARFSPSASLVNQVRLCCPISTKGNRALKSHEKNHHNVSAAPSARPIGATEHIRRSIAAQMGG
jgi:hypothetical protein